MINKLLIIGNGFDLYCNLPSKFEDYFNEKKGRYSCLNDFIPLLISLERDQNSFDNRFISYISKYKNQLLKEISIWDLYFLGSSMNEFEINWYNIEGLLETSLIKKKGKPTFWEKIKVQLADTFFNVNQDCHNTNLPSLEIIIYMILKYILVEDFTKPVLILNQDEITTLTENWTDFLFAQLKIFETDFKEYIIRIQKENELYFLAQKNCIEKLLLEYKEASIMTFNYTQIQNNGEFNSVENVHGIAASKSGIIIGIDNTKSEPEDNVFLFTKTYRKVEMYTINPQKVINKTLSKDITHIVFFGHSLNEQDYSYFQTIFDYFNLYDNRDLILDFRYYIYDQANELSIKKKTIMSVISLLYNYGKTLDNSYKGKNLLHKLLNESRLIIKLI